MREEQIKETLLKVAEEYPADMVRGQAADATRVSFNIQLALSGAAADGLCICDIGGGVGLFSVGCKALGFQRSVLVDDFRDSINLEKGEEALDLHRRYGVEIVSHDAVANGLDVEGPFDVITTFDSMEHWHHSPKRLFEDVMQQLKSGGKFVLGVPNCVNLRKRLTIPFGVGKWSSLEDWYEPETFRGHVREPDVGDLRLIARKMGLIDTRIVGRNWTGHSSPNKAIRICTRIADVPLRIIPSLCGVIYLIGEKP